MKQHASERSEASSASSQDEEPGYWRPRNRVKSRSGPEQHDGNCDDDDDSALESVASSSGSFPETSVPRTNKRQLSLPLASSSLLSPSSSCSASPTPSTCSSSSSSVTTTSRRWIRKEKIGQGAQGSVYRCEEVGSGREIAAKIIHIQDLSPAEIEAIKREVRTMKRLEHRHLVRYIKASEKKSQKLVIYMEYVAGGALSSYVKRDGALPLPLVKRYTRQLCAVLQFLHANRIAHRDIKCANIFVSASQQSVKLGDFGTFKEIGSVSLVGGIKGTPHWMAPEVIREQQTSDDGWLKADIWSLGCAVLEMLTGHSPWQQYSNPLTAMYQIVCSNNTPTIPADAPEEATSFLQWCLQREPASRPTAAQLLAHSFLAKESSPPRRKSSTATGVSTSSSSSERRRKVSASAAGQSQQKLQSSQHSESQQPGATAPASVPPSSSSLEIRPHHADADNDERECSESDSRGVRDCLTNGAPAAPRKRSTLAREVERSHACSKGTLKASRIPRLKPLELARSPPASSNQHDGHDDLSPAAAGKATAVAARSRSEVLPRLRPKAPSDGVSISPVRLRRISTAPTPPSELKAGGLLALGRDRLRLPPLLSARHVAGT